MDVHQQDIWTNKGFDSYLIKGHVRYKQSEMCVSNISELNHQDPPRRPPKSYRCPVSYEDILGERGRHPHPEVELASRFFPPLCCSPPNNFEGHLRS